MNIEVYISDDRSKANIRFNEKVETSLKFNVNNFEEFIQALIDWYNDKDQVCKR